MASGAHAAPDVDWLPGERTPPGVYGVGGTADLGGAGLRTAELFDPADRRWVPLPPMRQGRARLACAAMGGKVRVGRLARGPRSVGGARLPPRPREAKSRGVFADMCVANNGAELWRSLRHSG